MGNKVREEKPDSEPESRHSTQDTSDADSDSSSGSKVDTNSNNNRTSGGETQRTVSFLEPPTFKPPPGFRSSSQIKSRLSAAVTSALANLEGKQILHITAPAFLPLSKIQELSLAQAVTGQPVLNYKGVDYGVSVDSRQSHHPQDLLLYNEKAHRYEKADIRDIPTYSIQEFVRLPNGTDTKVNGSLEPKTSKPRRPQPRNLKMRFHPVGSRRDLPPETIGSSSESEEEPTVSKPPRPATEDRERKRKAEEEVEGKSKKMKLSSSQEVNPPPSSQVDAPSQTTLVRTEERGREEKQREKSKHRDETSQERRARKEEKKRKKEEKKRKEKEGKEEKKKEKKEKKERKEEKAKKRKEKEEKGKQQTEPV